MQILREVRRKEHLFSSIEQSKNKGNRIELIIETESGKQSEVAAMLSRIGEVKRVYELIPFVSIRCGPQIAEHLANYVHDMGVSASFQSTHSTLLKKIKSVDVSSECSIVPSPEPWSDVYLDLKIDSLWNLQNIGAYKAHEISTGEGVNIAVIDTGCDFHHPQLRNKFGSTKGHDFVDNDSYPMDKEGHGTHVSGTACSDDYGVSLDSRLYAVRVLDEDGSGFESDVVAGIEWCVKHNMDVANMSLGSRGASRALEHICKVAYSNGVLLVAAAGNESYGPSYPAAFEESVIAVAAVDRANRHAGFSNIWKTNDISAPGVNIMSCWLGGGYTIASGTSMASPHVTGAIALALGIFYQNPGLLEDYLNSTAQHLNSSSDYDDSWVFGAGLIRADKLMNKIVNDSRFSSVIRNRYSI